MNAFWVDEFVREANSVAYYDDGIASYLINQSGEWIKWYIMEPEHVRNERSFSVIGEPQEK